MVLFLAGLTAIPSEIQDAATLDGADSFWRRLFTVTLPLLSPTMLFVVTTSSITAFKLFDAVAVLTKGGPQGATDVLLYATYREGFENLNTAGAAAMTVVFLVIIVAGSKHEFQKSGCITNDEDASKPTKSGVSPAAHYPRAAPHCSLYHPVSILLDGHHFL